ncbi:DUF4189 domain-containing protein [Luteimonas panaciterrae]|uniref:DUF4189 domain-containing protein n=1 Tax=Luteimonas panaciterrae TaxID=363885 RepID=UPI001CFB98C6|nr:DUF4189 domain-containing protein [Luteimonas panaciterrae]
MKAKVLLMMGLLALSGMAYAEGGCPQGQTPRLYGDVWGCAPGGTDAPIQETQVAPQPTGEWKTTWGAIGGNALKGILGAAVGLPSEKEAVQAALADCRAKGGGAGCKLDISYYNQCAVLVTGNKVYNTASAATVEEASQIGINKCAKEDANCRVFYSACSKPEFVNY